MPPLDLQFWASLVRHDIQEPVLDQIMLIIATVKIVFLFTLKDDTQLIIGINEFLLLHKY